ncbi:MAG: alpha-mannosidase, partial [Anaerolineae bacterium]|nr:alpha-mannosidase [Anaerolineae bacterium]
MRFTTDKINARLAELWQLRFWERQPLALQWQPGRLAKARPDAWLPAQVGTVWDGPGRRAAFRAVVETPAAWAGKPVALRLRLANYQAGDPDAPAYDPQALLYVDGHPVYGLDMFHDEAVLTDAATPGHSWEIGIDAEAGIQSPHSPGLLVAEVIALDQNAVDLYYDAQVALDSALLLPEHDYRRERMLKSIDEAMLRVEWRGPLGDAFRASLIEADRYLRENLYEAMTAGPTPIVIATGHSHIDVAWLWTLAQVREKCARTFSTSLRLMERYPEYCYIQSQPQLYQFVQEDYPEIFQGIRQRVAEGRWEPLGCTWVEMDCNLSGGESLVRQFLFGTRYFRRAFGTSGTRVLWLPDVFGYPASLPQIMARSGCPYFGTAKLTWNEYNRMPYNSFRWSGIDGTEVVSHLLTIPALYWRPKVGTPISSYDAMLTPGELTGAWERYGQKDVHEELLITFGHGDGGGGSKPEMVERSRRLTDLPGIPRLRPGRVADFFSGLARVADRLPVWHGELYFEYHRGTYTTQAANKRANRQSEYLYHNAELFASLAHLWGHAYPQERLNQGWEMILLNQFHDILPGSSIPAVYKDSQAQYAQVRAAGEAVLNDALKAIAAQVGLPGSEPSLIVFNSLGCSRTDVVETTVPLTGDFTLLDSAGQPVPYQVVTDAPAGRTILFTAAGVPSCGYRAYRLRPGASAAQAGEAVRLSGNVFENRFFRAKFNKAGQLTSLYDKVAQREAIAPGRRGNVLQHFEDKPIEFDAWDIP